MASNSEFLRLEDKDTPSSQDEYKVIMRDNTYTDTTSDKLYANACWAAKEEWEEFYHSTDHHGCWLYAKVNTETPLYAAVTY